MTRSIVYAIIIATILFASIFGIGFSVGRSYQKSQSLAIPDTPYKIIADKQHETITIKMPHDKFEEMVTKYSNGTVFNANFTYKFIYGT